MRGSRSTASSRTSTDPGERLGQALTRVTEQYGATPEADRVYRVDQAIRNLVFYVVVSIAVGTRSQDIKLVAIAPARCSRRSSRSRR